MNESNPPIEIQVNEAGDRMAVWNSSSHPDDSEAKEVLRRLGYQVQTLGEVYTITGGIDLIGIGTGLENVYGIAKCDRSNINPT